MFVTGTASLLLTPHVFYSFSSPVSASNMKLLYGHSRKLGIEETDVRGEHFEDFLVNSIHFDHTITLHLSALGRKPVGNTILVSFPDGVSPTLCQVEIESDQKSIMILSKNIVFLRIAEKYEVKVSTMQSMTIQSKF